MSSPSFSFITKADLPRLFEEAGYEYDGTSWVLKDSPGVGDVHVDKPLGSNTKTKKKPKKIKPSALSDPDQESDGDTYLDLELSDKDDEDEDDKEKDDPGTVNLKEKSDKDDDEGMTLEEFEEEINKAWEEDEVDKAGPPDEARDAEGKWTGSSSIRDVTDNPAFEEHKESDVSKLYVIDHPKGSVLVEVDTIRLHDGSTTLNLDVKSRLVGKTYFGYSNRIPIGIAGVKAIRRRLVADFPNAMSLSGWRVTGTRSVKGRVGGTRTQINIRKRISGSSDISLNNEGRKLAYKLGKRIVLKGGLDVLHSSPLARATETADLIAESNPNMKRADPSEALQPWHLGSIEGREPSDVSNLVDHYLSHPDEVPPGKGLDREPGETFDDAKKRQLDFLSNVYQDSNDHPNLKIGVVMHSRGVELLKSWVDADSPKDYELDYDDLVNPDDPDHADMLRWHNDKIKEIDLDDDDELKPGVYLILHSLTDDDSDKGNPDLKKTDYEEPPNLRDADDEERCGTCKYFDDGHCNMYDGYPVEAKQVCDEYVEGEPGTGKLTKYDPNEERDSSGRWSSGGGGARTKERFSQVLWAVHPTQGPVSVDSKHANIVSHADWFHNLGLPTSRQHLVPRGIANIDHATKRVMMSSTDSLGKFPSNSVINHIKGKYGLHNYEFHDNNWGDDLYKAGFSADEARDEHGRWGSGSWTPSPAAKMMINRLQSTHDTLKQHKGREYVSSGAAQSHFRRGVEDLGNQIHKFINHYSMDAKVLRSRQVLDAVKHGDSTLASDVDALGNKNDPDNALSWYHDAITTISSASGSSWVGKSLRYLPPLEVLRDAQKAYEEGMAVIDVTAPMAEGDGLDEEGIRKIAEHFSSVEASSDRELTRCAWGGKYAQKWANRVIRKIDNERKEFEPSIGVDLDKTLAEHSDKDFEPLKIGKPIPKMIARVKQALADGKNIKIFTARVADDPEGKIKRAIETWSKEYIGQVLPVTNEKDPGMTEIWDDRARQVLPNEGVFKAGSGITISFVLDPETAKTLALTDGEKPEDMHITLAYLGRLSNYDPQLNPHLENLVQSFASSHAPLTVELGGPARFNATEHSDGKDVVVASVQSKDIHDYRDDLVKALDDSGLGKIRYPSDPTLSSMGFEDYEDFEYTPHVTLAYIDPDADMSIERVDPITVTFDKISLSIGSDRKDYELTGTPVEKTDEDPDSFEIHGDIIKLDKAKHLVFGFFSITQVNGKNIADTQGDIITPETLEDSAYSFVLNARKAGHMHESDKDGEVKGIGRLVESVVFTKEKQEAIVKSLHDQGINGAVMDLKIVGWFGGMKIEDPDVWKKVTTGELKAWSIGGRGKRDKIDEDAS